jgi:hypothetical protein
MFDSRTSIVGSLFRSEMTQDIKQEMATVCF